MTNTPSVGRIVHYTLSQQDALHINKRRKDAAAHLSTHVQNSTGVQIHVGNGVAAGEVYPMVITRVWGGSGLVNGQVLLDGNDLLWVTSVGVGEGERTYAWPPRT